MSDQTPRVPDIWWSPTKALVGGYEDRVYFTLQVGHVTELSADAVKLGDVEELRAEIESLRSELAGMEDMAVKTRDFNAGQLATLHGMIMRAIGSADGDSWPGNKNAAEALGKLGDVEALRAEIREVLTDDGLRRYGAIGATRRIRAILDRPAAAPGERDQGGEYPCTSCGTTGWDCLTAMNASPVDARCCADCGLNDTHSCPAAAPAEPREDTVPCGRDDEDCSLRGGTAHCGGCRE